MSQKKDRLNPYSILGVERNATIQEIKAAYNNRIKAAAYTPLLSVSHIEAAYRILKDPELRERLNRKLDAQTMSALASETVPKPVSSSQEDPEKISRRKIVLLLGLLPALGFSLYFSILRERGAICPKCHHATLYQFENSDGRFVLACTRSKCNYSYVYEKEKDTEENEKRENGSNNGSLNEGEDGE